MYLKCKFIAFASLIAFTSQKFVGKNVTLAFQFGGDEKDKELCLARKTSDWDPTRAWRLSVKPSTEEPWHCGGRKQQVLHVCNAADVPG